MVPPLRGDPSDPNAIGWKRGASYVVHPKEKSRASFAGRAIDTNVIDHENSVRLGKSRMSAD
jgi:hypothetical protein